jgi:hypothetical protein
LNKSKNVNAGNQTDDSTPGVRDADLQVREEMSPAVEAGSAKPAGGKTLTAGYMRKSKGGQGLKMDLALEVLNALPSYISRDGRTYVRVVVPARFAQNVLDGSKTVCRVIGFPDDVGSEVAGIVPSEAEFTTAGEKLQKQS